MIFTVTSKNTNLDGSGGVSIEGPIRIKVPGRNAKDDPYLGFTSKDLAETFMRMKSLSEKEFCVVPFEALGDSTKKNKPVLIYENEQQIIEAERYTEGYDYESLIHHNAL